MTTHMNINNNNDKTNNANAIVLDKLCFCETNILVHISKKCNILRQATNSSDIQHWKRPRIIISSMRINVY